MKSGRTAWATHADLDPKNVKKNAAGVRVRESRDSDAHPESNAIGVIFDVTGSMGGIPVVLQEKLPQLLTLLTSKGYIPDPQVLFGAVTDYYSNQMPLQVGQFESGNEMEGDLSKIVLEGGGGGGNHESYIEALYFFARHTSIDCYEKRGKKGYLFIIGDEQNYKELTVAEAKEVFDDSLQANISLQDVVKEAQEKYNVFFIFPLHGSYTEEMNCPHYRELFGENVIVLPDESAVCETIAATIGMFEGTIDLDEAKKHLRDAGASTAAVAAVGTALDPLSKALVRTGSADLSVSAAPPVSRL